MARVETASWRVKIAPYLLLSLVVVATFFPLWQGKMYATGDMRDVSIPLELFFQRELRAGRLPAWNPDIAWGFPVIASAQIGFFYPPLLLLRLAPIWVYLPLALFGHALFASYGMYYFLRVLRRTTTAALLGAVVFALHAHLWQHLTHLNIFLATSWLPWQLIAAYYAARWPSTRYLALLTGAIAMPFLIGQLQVPLLMALVSIIYFGVSRYRRGGSLRTVSLTAMGIGIAAMALCAVQLAPTVELLLQSSRGIERDFSLERANQHSFPLYHAPTILFPRFFGTDDTYWGKRLEIEYGIFAGALPLMLVLLGWRWLPRNPSVRFFKYALLVAFLLSLGGGSPFRLIGFEPSLWFFSAPARWLLIVAASFAVLVAYGWDSLRDREIEFQRSIKKVFFILMIAVVLYTVGIFFAAASSTAIATQVASTPYYQEKIVQLLASLRSTSISLYSPYTWLPVLALAVALWWPKKSWHTAVLGVTVAELVIIAATTSPTLDWSELLTPPASIAALPPAVQQREERLLSITPPGGDTGAWLTNPSSRANKQIRAEQRELLVPLLSSQFGIASVQWPASLDISSQSTALERLVPLLDPSYAASLNIGTILAPLTVTLPLESAALVDAHTNLFSLPARPRAEVRTTQGAHTAQYEEISPSEKIITTDSATDGVLVIRDTYYPGWRAAINTTPVAITPIDDLFQAVAVPSGQQTIRLTYHPVWVYRGLAVSVASVAIFGLVLALGYGNQRLSRRHLGSERIS